MGKAKQYLYDYTQYEEEGKGPATMVEDILADPEFAELSELSIGSWGNAWEDDCQPILDGIVEQADKFAHIKKLFIGDMDYEDCEVSWILQGDYSRLWAAMPQLKELTIKGSEGLALGQICHEGLEALTIICGGLPVSVIQSIREAKLPDLKSSCSISGSRTMALMEMQIRSEIFWKRQSSPSWSIWGSQTVRYRMSWPRWS